MPKTSSAILEYKRRYYRTNKERLLARKRQRKEQIYANKVARTLFNSGEWEKEFIREMSRKYDEKKDRCELCGVRQSELSYPLQLHHPDYSGTSDTWTLCVPCHVTCDRYRRSQDQV